MGYAFERFFLALHSWSFGLQPHTFSLTGSLEVVSRARSRKCHEDCKTMCNLATNDVDIAIAYPNVRVQTGAVILCRTVMKH